jgi:natural product precursor
MKSLKLNQLITSELEKREMRFVVGGHGGEMSAFDTPETCSCICCCGPYQSMDSDSNAEDMSDDLSELA